MKKPHPGIIAVIFIVTFGILKFTDIKTPPAPAPAPAPISELPKPSIEIATPHLTKNVIDSFLSRTEVVSLMQQWANEAPRLCEFGTYGKTSKGTDCNYLRMGTKGKPKILIHSCIHGNERLATAATLNIMAKLLGDYRQDDEATWILNNRDIYFVPTLSPDTYLVSRHVEGVDPNRNFPSPENPNIKSASPLLRIREFCKEHKFAGVIDGHTFGRDFFYPRIGDKDIIGPLAREMASLAGYKASSVGGEYPTRNPNSRGYAIDWYYWSGSVAILTEFGTGRGGHNMPANMIVPEFQKTYPAYLLFMRKAPEIQSKLNPPDGFATVANKSRETYGNTLPQCQYESIH